MKKNDDIPIFFCNHYAISLVVSDEAFVGSCVQGQNL